MTAPQVFSYEFWEITKNTYCIEHLWTAAQRLPCDAISSYVSSTWKGGLEVTGDDPGLIDDGIGGGCPAGLWRIAEITKNE